MFTSVAQIQWSRSFLWKLVVPACLSFTRNTVERLSVENSHAVRCVCATWTSKNPRVLQQPSHGQTAPGGRVLQSTPRSSFGALPLALCALSERPSSQNQMLREARPCYIRVTCSGKNPTISTKLSCSVEKVIDVLF